MNKADLAAIFNQMADMMEVLGEDRFRVGSYRNVGRYLAETTADLDELARAGRLEELPGIGKSTAGKIEEYAKTGKITRHQELLAQVPAGLPDLMHVQGLGPKTVLKLWKEAKITSVAELRAALNEHPEKLAELPGLGDKKVAQIKESLTFVESVAGRFRLDEAGQAAEALCQAVRACEGAERVEVAGSLRRYRETVGDVDILCQAGEADAEAIIGAFVSAPGVAKVLAQGTTKGSVVTGGHLQADLRVVPAESFGAALAYFTGSKAHNIAVREIAVKHKLKLNEYGLFRERDGKEERLAGRTEEEIYKALGMAWVPPELREDRGEIEAALAGKLPDLVTLEDIRGDLHMHTTASDGVNSIDEMIDACRARGYQYMAITDHSKSQFQAKGLDEERLARHVEAIHAAAKRHKDIVVLAGIEVDILKDGTLDFSDDVLATLDFVTASPHAALTQKGPEATRRLIRAIENPYVHVIGHPSGRLINQRAGMEIDIEKIAAAAAANGTALELNAHPWRLDLRDVHVRAAVAAGAKLLICTDAHSAAPDGNLNLMRFGVATARRGWATAADVINTSSAAELKKWLAAKR